MSLIYGIHALRDEARRAGNDLRDRGFFGVLIVFALLLIVAAQAPLDYSFDVGREDGYGSDLPLVADFFAPEQIDGTSTNLRWTNGDSRILLPGLGQRTLEVQLRMLPVVQEMVERGPREMEAWADGQLLARFALRPTSGGLFTILVPPAPGDSGDHTLELRSATHAPAGDARALGTPVDTVRVRGRAGFALPPWRDVVLWLGSAFFVWLALRRVGLNPRPSQLVLVALVALVALAAWLDPPRFALGADIALLVAGLGWLLMLAMTAETAALRFTGAVLFVPLLLARLLASGEPWSSITAAVLVAAVALLLAGALRPVLERFYTTLAPPSSPEALCWLRLLTLVVFVTHFGGKIYPESMWGDIGFHAHRVTDVASGLVLILSSNRGVPFPYPSALYVLLEPFTLTGFDERLLLRFVGALFDALSPWLVYTIVRCAMSKHRASERIALFAGGMYGFMAATLMTTWWNFSSHIFTQFTHLLLITLLIMLWPWLNAHDRRFPGWAIFMLLVVAQVMVYLGHFGFWMNMSLLGAGGLAVLLLGAWRRRVAWRAFWFLFAAYVAAELFAVLFYYSAYTGLFIQQAEAAAGGGLTGLANRGSVGRDVLWRTLWVAGFQTHLGLFPLPLAICGLLMLRYVWRKRAANWIETHRALIGLMVGTFAIAALFASLPFLTGSTLATRWLMFSVWAIAVGAALAGHLLWHSGRAGRWLVVAISCYVVWGTAAMWLNALAWRIRPPEPF